jgi:ribosome biogenesis GTPase
MNFNEIKIGRVVAVFRELFLVELSSTNELIKTKCAGKFYFENESHPTVGDLVEVSENGFIKKVMPRKSALFRKASSDKGAEQLMGANIDYVFITTSLNGDLNFKRIDRYLLMVHESGALPILLFTKLDLIVEDLKSLELKESIKKRFPNVPTFFCSKENCLDEKFIKDQFKDYLSEKSVWVLVGSSGVGKSTFINSFLDESIIKTNEIRFDDDKGKHTTTHRQMYKTKFGPWIIDSPGIRELDVDPTTDVLDLFSDIEEISLRCKFSDCTHESEPQCAIIDAIAKGELEKDRFESYRKLYLKKSFDLRTLSIESKIKVREGWKKHSLRSRREKKIKNKVF